MKKIILVLLGLLLMFSVSAYNITEEISLEECFDDNDLIIVEFKEAELNHLRIDDLITLIDTSYSMNADFETIMQKCEEVNKVKKMAYDMQDRIGAMNLFYEETFEEPVEHIDKMIDEVYSDFNDEQYELIEDKVDKIYNEIIDYKSSQTAVKIFYDSTRNQVIYFLEVNYKNILIVVGSILFLFLIFRRRIKIIKRKRKIGKIELRKEVLKELIKKTQADYFRKNKISSGLYEIRLKKFSEMVRDLDKDVLTIKEELMRIRRVKEK